MPRELATIQKVTYVEPIIDADRIELIHVLNWQVVTKKGQFKSGDIGVFFEIDSIVPDKPCYDFMKERKFRVKTISLKKTLSQGLFMPLGDVGITKKVKEGMDVTELLGVTKWEPPEPTIQFMPPKNKSWFWKLVYTVPFLKFLRKKVGTGTSFPTHLVPKTDEERLQSFPPEFFETYKDLKVSVSQKMDGSSGTYIWYKKKFSVASRNVWMVEKQSNYFWNMADQCQLKERLKRVMGKIDVAIQGEVCGPGIQDNKYNFKKLTFLLFGAYDIKKQEYYTPEQLADLYELLDEAVEKSDDSNFLMADVLASDVTLSSIGTNIQDWIKFASTKSRFNPESWNEGIVVRSMDNKPYGIRKMNGKRFSFKVISPEFNLQYGL